MVHSIWSSARGTAGCMPGIMPAARIPGWPVAARDQFISSAALVDLTGDDLPDVVAGSKDGFLYAWNGRGQLLPGFPVSLGALCLLISVDRRPFEGRRGWPRRRGHRCEQRHPCAAGRRPVGPDRLAEVPSGRPKQRLGGGGAMSGSSPQPPEIQGSVRASDRDRMAPPLVEGPGGRSRTMLRLVLSAILAVVIAWFMLKEAIEPHWTIRLGDLVRPGPPPVTMALGSGLAVRAYPDTRPHVGKITPLQKGLVLVQDGRGADRGGLRLRNTDRSAGRAFLRVAARRRSPCHPTTGRLSNASTSTRKTPGRNRSAGSTARSSRWAALSSPIRCRRSRHPGCLRRFHRSARQRPDLAYLANEQGARAFTLYSDSSGAQPLLRRRARHAGSMGADDR